ncbi:MAG TPA: hypothetical protein DDX68_20775 [Clostridium sp.]|nr:hypothetical protein [Clostridium sp.]
MNSIKQSALAEEIQMLKEISKDRTLKVSEKYQMIEDLGYTFKYLGSGSSAYTCAHQVGVLNIHSRKYLNGNYLVYGTCNIAYGRGVIYRGYVKLIIPD